MDLYHTPEGRPLGDPRLVDHEARIAWLETEIARLARKVDGSLSMEGYDTPTPQPAPRE